MVKNIIELTLPSFQRSFSFGALYETVVNPYKEGTEQAFLTNGGVTPINVKIKIIEKIGDVKDWDKDIYVYNLKFNRPFKFIAISDYCGNQNIDKAEEDRDLPATQWNSSIPTISIYGCDKALYFENTDNITFAHHEGGRVKLIIATDPKDTITGFVNP